MYDYVTKFHRYCLSRRLHDRLCNIWNCIIEILWSVSVRYLLPSIVLVKENELCGMCSCWRILLLALNNMRFCNHFILYYLAMYMIRASFGLFWRIYGLAIGNFYHSTLSLYMILILVLYSLHSVSDCPCREQNLNNFQLFSLSLKDIAYHQPKITHYWSQSNTSSIF